MGRNKKGDSDGVREFFWVLHLGFDLALWLAVISVLSVGAALLAAHYWWHADPVAGVEHLLGYYLAQTTDPALARTCADGAYWSWFGWTGIDAAAREFALGLPASSAMGNIYRHTLFTNLYQPLTVAMMAMKLFGVRVAMLAMAAPAFGMALAAFLADGLAGRHIRREDGANESATRYHRAKRWFTFGMIPLTAIIWLVAPVRIPLVGLFLPVTGFCALLIWNMAKYYKKYV
ncbi:DUF4400 domain-containing protein [Pandoraea sp.]|uniref:DUF4400 domain-containing protein n=1 Tax=Pandoraea sp. TaxID=1883445 RepID=UPI0011F71FF0|nr:DUF4400 domain-containing protein [Pandoraea sp.]TAL56896.1 MAG: DUF4400 domain-containing protein [Pandoraea sp.]TAM17690.1 MAG: DUF4400 domain-containing protein [Pandoraea sp.]